MNKSDGMPEEFWIPADIYYKEGAFTADWVDLSVADGSLPFLGQQIAAAQAAGAGSKTAPLPPAEEDFPVSPPGLIFHAGRCGSTLLSVLLSNLPQCRLMVEPPVLNRILSADGLWPFLPAEIRAEALKRVVFACARAANRMGCRTIFKLSSWNALHLPVFQKTFPAVPCLFLYRKPVEILVSLMRQPPSWGHRADTVTAASLFFRLPPSQVPPDRQVLMAQTVGRLMQNVADAIEQEGDASRWLLIPYEELLRSGAGAAAGHFGLTPMARSQAAAQSLPAHHARDSSRPFSPDSAEKQAAADPELIRLAESLIGPAYERLESLRRIRARGRA